MCMCDFRDPETRDILIDIIYQEINKIYSKCDLCIAEAILTSLEMDYLFSNPMVHRVKMLARLIHKLLESHDSDKNWYASEWIIRKIDGAISQC